MSAESKAVVRKYYQLLDEGDTEGITGIFTDDLSWDFPGQPEPLNKEALIGMAGAFKSAFPDLKHNIMEQWTDGDCVFTLLNVKGTMQNEMMGIPASGMKIDINAQNIHWIKNDKIRRGDTKFDNLQFMQQIGAIPVEQS